MKKGWILVIGLSFAVAAAVALAQQSDAKKGAAQSQPMPGGKANAAIEGRSGSKLTGTAEFVVHGGMTMVTVSVKDAPPGVHAVHIHEKGDCSAPDATSAGGHFNPGGHQHGAPDGKEHHAGDLGNLTVIHHGAQQRSLPGGAQFGDWQGDHRSR